MENHRIASLTRQTTSDSRESRILRTLHKFQEIWLFSLKTFVSAFHFERVPAGFGLTLPFCFGKWEFLHRSLNDDDDVCQSIKRSKYTWGSHTCNAYLGSLFAKWWAKAHTEGRVNFFKGIEDFFRTNWRYQKNHMGDSHSFSSSEQKRLGKKVVSLREYIYLVLFRIPGTRADL